MGLIADDICVFVGVVVVWLAKGCSYGLWERLKEVEAGDFWRRSEGMIGLATLAALFGGIWAAVHFLGKAPR